VNNLPSDARASFPIYLHAAGKCHAIDVTAETTVRQVLTKAGVSAAPGQHVVGDAGGSDGELSPALELDATVAGCALEGHAHIAVTTCPALLVTVQYQSRSFQRRFRTVAPVEFVVAWIRGQLASIGAEGRTVSLQLCGQTGPVREATRLVDLLSDTSCALCFDLLLGDKVEG